MNPSYCYGNQTEWGRGPYGYEGYPGYLQCSKSRFTSCNLKLQKPFSNSDYQQTEVISNHKRNSMCSVSSSIPVSDKELDDLSNVDKISTISGDSSIFTSVNDQTGCLSHPLLTTSEEMVWDQPIRAPLAFDVQEMTNIKHTGTKVNTSYTEYVNAK